jgi:hypothetical protein
LIAQEAEAVQAEAQEVNRKVNLKKVIYHPVVSASDAVRIENAYKTLITASEITALLQLLVPVPPQIQCPFKAGDCIETYIIL